MLLSIVARVACATVLLAAGVSAAVSRGPLDEIDGHELRRGRRHGRAPRRPVQVARV